MLYPISLILDKFMLVYIPLNAQENTYSTIRGILNACNLPTDQLDKIQRPKSSKGTAFEK